jgi:hypothetical protein
LKVQLVRDFSLVVPEVLITLRRNVPALATGVLTTEINRPRIEEGMKALVGSGEPNFFGKSWTTPVRP